MQTLIDQSVARVEAAAAQIGKLALARAARVSEAGLRLLGRRGWNPTAGTLRKLEHAALSMDAENGAGGAAGHRVHRNGGPVVAKAAKS